MSKNNNFYTEKVRKRKGQSSCQVEDKIFLTKQEAKTR